MTAPDPFDDLAMPTERAEPRPSFARSLRARIVAELGVADEPPPEIRLPERTRSMTTTTSATTATTAPTTNVTTAVTPYLAVHDAGAALDWYVEAFGAVEQLRVVGDDGRVGHAEFRIGDAAFYLSDEHPEFGVVSPRTLGGTPVALHLTVDDVDAIHARAVVAGATSQSEPEDQPHGARHGTIVDPFGYRWMLSQPIEQVSADEYAARAVGSGYEVIVADIPGTTAGETIAAADRPGTGGGIWAGVFYDDALAAIRFLVDTFGFEEQLVVVADDDRTVVHSQLRWPEGGIVQVGTYDPDNMFTHAPGDQSLYVVTADPPSVWERCRAAGLEVVRAPETPDHDPGGTSFTVRDRERNIWTFGTYGLGQDT